MKTTVYIQVLKKWFSTRLSRYLKPRHEMYGFINILYSMLLNYSIINAIYKYAFIKLFWLAIFWWLWLSSTISNQEDTAMLTYNRTYIMVTDIISMWTKYIGYVNFWYSQGHVSPPYSSMPHNSWSMEETKHRNWLSDDKHEWWEVLYYKHQAQLRAVFGTGSGR